MVSASRVEIGYVSGGDLDSCPPGPHGLVVEAVGVSVHLRDVETLDDLADVTAPGPVEPGDLVACADELYRVEVVLWTLPGEACVPGGSDSRKQAGCGCSSSGFARSTAPRERLTSAL